MALPLATDSEERKTTKIQLFVCFVSLFILFLHENKPHIHAELEIYMVSESRRSFFVTIYYY